MGSILSERSLQKRLVTKPTDPHGLILEAWAQGFMVGALIIMSCITLVNMRRGVILHKLILVEVGCPEICQIQLIDQDTVTLRYLARLLYFQ